MCAVRLLIYKRLHTSIAVYVYNRRIELRLMALLMASLDRLGHGFLAPKPRLLSQRGGALGRGGHCKVHLTLSATCATRIMCA